MRLARWAVLNFGLFGLLGCWHFGSQYWALNLFTFGFWLSVVLTFLTAATEEGRRAAKKSGRSVPAWASHCLDVVLICVLAAWGWFWMASFWFIQMAVQIGLYDDLEESA